MAKVATLTDGLGSFDNLKWAKTETTAGSDITFASGRMSMRLRSANTTYRAITSWDLTSSEMYCEIVSHPGATASGSAEMYFYCDISSGLYGYGWIIRNNPLEIVGYYKNNSFTVTTAGTALTYNNTTHRWVKISESGGTITWWTSTNGSSWTSRYTLANLAFDHTLIFPTFATGDWNADNLTAGVYDNFNTPPIISSRTYRRRGTRFFNRKF